MSSGPVISAFHRCMRDESRRTHTDDERLSGSEVLRSGASTITRFARRECEPPEPLSAR